jgi:hypothetical protein
MTPTRHVSSLTFFPVHSQTSSRAQKLKKKITAVPLYKGVDANRVLLVLNEYVGKKTEYATVGYMGKRIQMRKTRILALQKLAEKKHPPPLNWDTPGHSHGPPILDPEWMPKQTVSVFEINRSVVNVSNRRVDQHQGSL